MSDFVKVFVEIEKGSNHKYEWNNKTKKLELDRILPIQFKYPYSYGFIPETLGEDGDELDALLISEKPFTKNTYVYGYIVGVLKMEDEKGGDDKMLVLPLDDYLDALIEDTYDLNRDTLNHIEWFFANYKNHDEGKWSKVLDFGHRKEALEIFFQSQRKYKEIQLTSQNISI